MFKDSENIRLNEDKNGFKKCSAWDALLSESLL